MQDVNNFYKQVGENIRNQRGKNLSQEALAAAVGLTRTSISNIEKGRQRLLVHTLADIAVALKTDTAKLLPERNVPADGLGSSTLLHLPDDERAFIESALGIQRRGEKDHGSQTTENQGVGRVAPAREQRHQRSGAGLGNRTKKGSANRR